MEPGGSMPLSQVLSNNTAILRRINLIIRIDTYFFKIHFNIVHHRRLGLPESLFPVGLTNSMAYGIRGFTRAL